MVSRSHEVSVSGVRNRSIVASGAALIIGAAVAWHVYRFTLASGFDLFPGPRGDTRLTAYLVEHLYQVALNRAHFLSPAMFYPVTGTLGYSDTNILYTAPPYAFLRVIGLDIFHALAVTVVVFGYLNFLSGFILLNRVLKCGTLASTTGALFFAFNSLKLAQPDHLQLQPLFLLPIVVGLLLIFFMAPRHNGEGRAFIVLALAALAVDVQLLSAFYVGWFFLLWLVLLCALSLLIPDSRLVVLGALRYYRAAVIGAAIVFVVGLIPFLMVYLPAARTVGWSGILPQDIAEPRSYLLLADGNYVWGGVTASVWLRAAKSGPDWGRRVGVGLMASLVWIGASLNAVRTILRHVRGSAYAGRGGRRKSSNGTCKSVGRTADSGDQPGGPYRPAIPRAHAVDPRVRVGSWSESHSRGRTTVDRDGPSDVHRLRTGYPGCPWYLPDDVAGTRAVLYGVLLVAITFGCLESDNR